MSRLDPITSENAEGKTVELLGSVKRKFGMVPNMIATMAQSPAAARAYLGFGSSLASGVLPAAVREQIALTVGQKNSCDYCVAAHSALGKGAGLSEEELLAARQATSSDPKTNAILKFAALVVEQQGKVCDEALADARSQGVSEAEISETVANVALNIFTNYFNHVAETEVDFPEPAQLPVAVG